MSVPRPRLPGLDVSDAALLASLLQEAPVGFAFLGPDARVLRMNKAMVSLGGDDDAHPGCAPAEVWPADLAAAAESAARRVAAGDRPVPQTEHAVAAANPADEDAAVRHWSFSWFPSRDGDISGVAAIAVDVTAQHQAAEALRRSEERYRSLVQAGAQVVWVTRPDGAACKNVVSSTPMAVAASRRAGSAAGALARCGRSSRSPGSHRSAGPRWAGRNRTSPPRRSARRRRCAAA